MTSSALTVLIPHYGDPAATRALLQQLADQDPAPDLRVVVVDDSSPIAFTADSHVRVVRRERNGGFGAAVNTGLAETEHDLALVLNSDVSIGPRFVADLLAAAAPWQPAVVSPRVVGPDGVDAWVGRRFPTATQQAAEWLTPLARFRGRPAWHRAVGHDVSARGVTAEVDWVIGAAMLLPVAEVRAEGGFDERFHMNAEEVDLQVRLRARGVRSVVVAEPVIVHAGGGSSDPAQRREWLVSSRMRYAAKWGGLGRLRAALTAATGANLAVNAVRRVSGRDVAPIATARDELALIWSRG